MRQPAIISAERVEDLNLRRWARQTNAWGDWYSIDRRRLKRELRKLPKLIAKSRARFEAQAEESRYRRAHAKLQKFIVLDDIHDWPLTEADKKRMLEWWSTALTKAIPGPYSSQ